MKVIKAIWLVVYFYAAPTFATLLLACQASCAQQPTAEVTGGTATATRTITTTKKWTFEPAPKAEEKR